MTAVEGVGATVAPVTEEARPDLPLPGAGLGVPRRQENFPLAWLCGPRLRAARLAVYGFCRFVDDLGDEYQGDRLAALDALEEELRAAVAGRARHPVTVRLTPLLHGPDPLPVDPFLRLVEANRQDQRVTGYDGWDDLDAYCALSASPVGEIVLRLEGAATPARLEMSAQATAGLQYVNHWQDLAEDARRGRCYVPRRVLEQHRVTVDDLAAARLVDGFVPMLAECVDQARLRLRRGWPLAAGLHGRLRAEIAGFVAHGAAACDAVEAAGPRSLHRRPHPGRAGHARAAGTAVRALLLPGPLPSTLRP